MDSNNPTGVTEADAELRFRPLDVRAKLHHDLRLRIRALRAAAVEMDYFTPLTD
jgi:hypothetical protein